MGVPAFFRWLSQKYPSIIVHCVEESKKQVDGESIPIDTCQPNPNDVEFDNLYLDMNGIIHPCCHPENKPAPKNQDEMMVAIFEYIDRLFAIIRPRKLLYMAIDGVAPRAKMNQQRSRRFRAAQESAELRKEIAKQKEIMRSKGFEVPPDKPAAAHFDSNCITPGTEFMHHLSTCLQFYIHDRITNDAGWKNVQVVLSDANVPGEGEHKIMNYIRHQRSQPNHNPNTHHCLCGADADLIMLGFSTHEPHFTIIREEFKPNQPKACEICGQYGHAMDECTGTAREKQGEFDQTSVVSPEETEFIFIRLNVAREYLEKVLEMKGLSFDFSIDRAIDDWVFMCFFVGNDFLPHLPSLNIREGGIDRLIGYYKDTLRKTGGYLTDAGTVNLERVQFVLNELGEAEDEIFKKRRESDVGFRKREKVKRRRNRSFKHADRPKFIPGGQFAPTAVGSRPGVISNPQQTIQTMRTQGHRMQNMRNANAAEELKSMLTTGDLSSTNPRKRTSSEANLNEDSDSEPEPEDDVRLWEEGWKDRYYMGKFSVAPGDIEFRQKVAHEYAIGLCWVLQYYYQGCPSWKWYYPYHYAPFASDFMDLENIKVEFPKKTRPFRPLEQLMSVFPAHSKQFLPPVWQTLMTDPESPIIDFYPSNFKIDLNGKKFAWMGVALLPFVDEERLHRALESVYSSLTPVEKMRNSLGSDILFIGRSHGSSNFVESMYEGNTFKDVDIDPKDFYGMAGTISSYENCYNFSITISSPLPDVEDINNNQALCMKFCDPHYDDDHIFPAVLLSGAKYPPRVLKPGDFERHQAQAGRRGGSISGFQRRGRGGGGRGFNRPQLGFSADSHYRMPGTRTGEVVNRSVRGLMGAPLPLMQNTHGSNFTGGHRSFHNPLANYQQRFHQQNYQHRFQHQQGNHGGSHHGHYQGQHHGAGRHHQRRDQYDQRRDHDHHGHGLQHGHGHSQHGGSIPHYNTSRNSRNKPY